MAEDQGGILQEVAGHQQVVKATEELKAEEIQLEKAIPEEVECHPGVGHPKEAGQIAMEEGEPNSHKGAQHMATVTLVEIRDQGVAGPADQEEAEDQVAEGNMVEAVKTLV